MRRVNFCSVTTVIVGLLAMNVERSHPRGARTRRARARRVRARRLGGPRCKRIHGDLVEVPATVGCKPEHTSCFLGEVDANHGLRGTTYFKVDTGSAPHVPDRADVPRIHGELRVHHAARDAHHEGDGATEPFNASNPESGVVNAYQRVVGGTDEFEGATGYLFVSGFNRNQRVVTTLHGVICKAPHGHQ